MNQNFGRTRSKAAALMTTYHSKVKKSNKKKSNKNQLNPKKPKLRSDAWINLPQTKHYQMSIS